MPELNSLAALPPITAASISLTDIILAAFKSAVSDLSKYSGEELWQEKTRLFVGYRRGSRVDGVRDQSSVELLFRRITTPPVNPDEERSVPMPSFPRTDAEGNLVYCFKLTHHYAHKGKSIYGRLSDLADIHELDRVSIGRDYDEEKDETEYRLQAPKRKYIESNVVTIILSSDKTKLIAWFCGEPLKEYNHENIKELLGRNGKLDLSRLWVTANVDFDVRSAETKRTMRQQKYHRQRYTPKPVAPPVDSPVNSLATALAVAQSAVQPSN